jgi:hypothetical protein
MNTIELGASTVNTHRRSNIEKLTIKTAANFPLAFLYCDVKTCEAQQLLFPYILSFFWVEEGGQKEKLGLRTQTSLSKFTDMPSFMQPCLKFFL